MNALRSAVAAVALVAAVTVPPASASGPAGGSGADRAVDRTWPDRAGGTVMAASGGKLRRCRGLGYANRRKGIEATCDTAYDVMSMTKQFTAAAILKLEMMGALDVSDPLAEHLGPVPADKGAITLHQLLTHSSGLRGGVGGDYERTSRAELISRALASKLRTAAGAKYHYSNVGYSLLAAVVEEASGMGYEEFLREQLFLPAGMRHTGYVLPDWKRGQVAVEYDRRGRSRGRPFSHPWAADGPWWNLRGNGGMLATARDMYRWHLALRGDDILDAAAKRKLFTPYVPETASGETHYGYGWVISRAKGLGRIAWHDGGNGWSYGLAVRLLARDGMVFWLTNSAYRRGEWSFDRLTSKLTGALARGL